METKIPETGAAGWLRIAEVPSTSLTGKVLRKFLTVIPRGTVIPVLQGPLRGTRWITGSSTAGCWLGTYESVKQKLFEKTVRPGATVYDIGANVGFYTLLASKVAGPGGRVYSFEPFPDNVRFLNRHLELNQVSNVTVFSAAVSSEDGESFFHPGPLSSMGRLSDKGTLPVKTIKLDTLLREGAIQPPQLLKIDVEGAEAGVLEGASRILSEYHPTIFLATHSDAVHKVCCDILRSHDYELASLTEEDIPETTELLATATNHECQAYAQSLRGPGASPQNRP